MSGSNPDYSLTPNLGLYKPNFDADTDLWGYHLNSNADTIDTALGGLQGGILQSSGGVMTGPLYWTTTGATTSRAAQDRSADRLNVLDFGAKGDGTTDDYAAVCAARDSIPSGSKVNLWFPANRSYSMSTAVAPNGQTLFFDVDPSSTLTGAAGALTAFYNAKYATMFSQQSEYLKINGPPQWFTTVGPMYDIYNDGTGSGGSYGYGIRVQYTTQATGAANQFDMMRGEIMTVTTPSVTAGSQWVGNWLVTITPQDATNGWGAYCAEWNPVNRGPDTGWSNARGNLPHWVGGLQIAPESQTFSAPGTGSNVLYAFAALHSATTNTHGFCAQVYNALLIEQNAIGPNGRGIYAGGYVATTGIPTSPLPYAPFQADYAWQNGIVMTGATFTGNAIATPGFAVDGSGNVTANNLKAASTLPLMDGAAAVGTGTTWARADHVHPSDTSRLATTGGTLSGGLGALGGAPGSNAFASPGFGVDGSGNLTTASFNATSTAFVNGTLTANTTLNVGNNTAGGPTLNINGASNTYRQISHQTAGSIDWNEGEDNNRNWVLNRWNPSGTYTDTPITVAWATGAVTLVHGFAAFGGTPPAAKPTLTGAKGGNTALASVIAALVAYGLASDSTTA